VSVELGEGHSEQFRSGLKEAGVTEEELLGELEDTKRELAEAGTDNGNE
jgi:hypothetical protein